ncbi:hypothetical protein ACB376_09245 [Klebsiella electrica]
MPERISTTEGAWLEISIPGFQSRKTHIAPPVTSANTHALSKFFFDIDKNFFFFVGDGQFVGA